MRKLSSNDRAPRVDTNLVGTVTGTDGETEEVIVLDISREGCRLRTISELVAGDRIAISVDHYGSYLADVRWAKGNDAGAIFLEPVVLP